MEKIIIDDMIKALKCVASQDAEGDCYADHENFMHIEDEKHKRILCEAGEYLKDYISGKDAVGCPYHQNTYGRCFEDGRLSWLKDVAELLEELKSYRDLEERLHKLFGEEYTFSLTDVVDTIEMKLSEPDKKHPVNARILTYEDADKWKEYKELEEQGLLLKLPCKEAYSKSGDFVYLIYDYEIIECVHCGLGIDPLSGKAYITLATDEKLFPYRSPDPEQDLDPTDWCTNVTDVEVSELGKTVFLTHEEAKKKLEEMKK